MKTEEALQFLMAHQPLLSEDANDQNISRFDDVRKFFSVNLDERCVPLLIGFLGPGDGHGTYVMVEDTLRLYPSEYVGEALRAGLKSPEPSVRYWSAQFSASYPTACIEDELIAAFLNGDADTQIAVVTAIEVIPSHEAKKMLLEVRDKSKNEDVLNLIDEVVGA